MRRQEALEDNFNPRSHKGSDKFGYSIANTSCAFQSTLPQGERLNSNAPTTLYLCISIHAPTRGATLVRKLSGVYRKFQSTLPQGERHGRCVKYDNEVEFQSTLPQGERLHLLYGAFQKHQFQSTLPQGERPNSAHAREVEDLFQSTLPQGERRTAF